LIYHNLSITFLARGQAVRREKDPRQKAKGKSGPQGPHAGLGKNEELRIRNELSLYVDEICAVVEWFFDGIDLTAGSISIQGMK
jgi:hypothetical protein